jgi:hypothetical protein
MTKVVTKFNPDMNITANLPKDYKEKNPNAKKSDYPALVGYTALHIGKLTKFFFSNENYMLIIFSILI